MKKVFRYEYDFIRIVSALAVLSIHVTSIHISTNRGAYLLNHLVRFCVPMFILLAGLVTPKLKENFNLGLYYKKKFKTVVIPYVFALAFYLLFEILYYVGSFDLIFFIKRFIYLFLNGYSHLYFLTIIIQLFLLYPLIRIFYKKNSKNLLFISFFISVYVQIAIVLIETKGIFIIPFTALIPYYVTFLPYIFYFVLGIYFNENNITEKISSNLYLIFWVASFGILLVESNQLNSFGSSLRSTIILYTISTFFLLIIIYKKFNLIKYKTQLRFLSGLTFGFYIFHMILLTLGKIYIFKGPFWISFVGLLTQLFLISIITGVCVYLYRKIIYYLHSIIKNKFLMIFTKSVKQLS